MKFNIEKEIIITHIDNEAVLLNIKTGKYFSLNQTGERIWELFQQHKDTEKVLNIMQNEYNADKNTLYRDIDHLISSLTNAGLLIPV